jgi:hypothetical protein
MTPEQEVLIARLERMGQSSIVGNDIRAAVELIASLQSELTVARETIAEHESQLKYDFSCISEQDSTIRLQDGEIDQLRIQLTAAQERAKVLEEALEPWFIAEKDTFEMTTSPDILEQARMVAKELFDAGMCFCIASSAVPYKEVLESAIGRSGILALASPQWQPIETAPKDGAPVDVWSGEYRVADAFFEGGKWLVFRVMKGRVPTYNVIEPPTHWMPLPAPPAQKD